MTALQRSRTNRRWLRRLGVSLVLAAGIAPAMASSAVHAHTPSESSGTVSVLNLREGSQGPGVRVVQEKLIGFGYYVAGGADGVFGPGTSAALRVFQRQNGLNPTGVVTENTARYLGFTDGIATTSGANPQGGAAPPSSTTSAPSSAVGLKRGMSGQSVRQLQLAILGTGLYLNGGADGTFGPSTERAVMLVQRVNGLPETGVVDATTARALGLGEASTPATSAPAGTVQYGATGAEVRRVQQLLMKSGVNVVGGADGVFGPMTRAAVRSFQQLHGLRDTGAVDAATDAKLVQVSGGNAAPQAGSSGYVGLRFGSTGAAVTKLQKAIMATGLALRGGADGIFGPATQRALMTYQQVNGLSATGVVNEATARLLGLRGSSGSNTGGGGTATGYAKYDERGARVVALQRALINARIVVPGGADGVFGSGTAGAVMKFQRAKGLSVTGRVDQATAQALGLQAMATPQPAAPTTVSLQAKPLASGSCYYGDTWMAPRGGGRVHLGVDIGGPEGTALQAVASGRVTQIYNNGSLAGNGLKITTADGTYFFYAHMKGFAPGIALGVPVRAGQVIGYMGNTGNAGISHLHLEVHPKGGSAINPYPLVKAIGAC